MRFDTGGHPRRKRRTHSARHLGQTGTPERMTPHRVSVGGPPSLCTPARATLAAPSLDLVHPALSVSLGSEDELNCPPDQAGTA